MRCNPVSILCCASAVALALVNCKTSNSQVLDSAAPSGTADFVIDADNINAVLSNSFLVTNPVIIAAIKASSKGLVDITLSAFCTPPVGTGAPTTTPPPLPGQAKLTLKDKAGSIIATGTTNGSDASPVISLLVASEGAVDYILEIDHGGRWAKGGCNINNGGVGFYKVGEVPPPANSNNKSVTSVLPTGATSLNTQFNLSAAGLFSASYYLSFKQFITGIKDQNGIVPRSGSSLALAGPASSPAPAPNTLGGSGATGSSNVSGSGSSSASNAGISTFPNPPPGGLGFGTGGGTGTGGGVVVTPPIGGNPVGPVQCPTPIKIGSAHLVEKPDDPTAKKSFDASIFFVQTTATGVVPCESNASYGVKADAAGAGFSIDVAFDAVNEPVLATVQSDAYPSNNNSSGNLPFQPLLVNIGAYASMAGPANDRHFPKGSVSFDVPRDNQDVMIRGNVTLTYAVNRPAAGGSPSFSFSVVDDDIGFSQGISSTSTGNQLTVQDGFTAPKTGEYTIKWQLTNPAPDMIVQLNLTPTFERTRIPPITVAVQRAKVVNKDSAVGDGVPTNWIAGTYPRAYIEDMASSANGTWPHKPDTFPQEPFQGATVLAAMEAVRNHFQTVVPAGVTKDPSHNTVDQATIQACLGNTPDQWSDIIMHYYCQFPGEIRSCYTGQLRSIAGSLQGITDLPTRIKAATSMRDVALAGCVPLASSSGRDAPAWKWLTTSEFKVGTTTVKQLDVFKYIMNSQVFAFASEDQEYAINTFYRVTDPSSPSTCSADRPARGHEPSPDQVDVCLDYDFGHNPFKSFSTPLKGVGR